MSFPPLLSTSLFLGCVEDFLAVLELGGITETSFGTLTFFAHKNYI